MNSSVSRLDWDGIMAAIGQRLPTEQSAIEGLAVHELPHLRRSAGEFNIRVGNFLSSWKTLCAALEKLIHDQDTFMSWETEVKPRIDEDGDVLEAPPLLTIENSRVVENAPKNACPFCHKKMATSSARSCRACYFKLIKLGKERFQFIAGNPSQLKRGELENATRAYQASSDKSTRMLRSSTVGSKPTIPVEFNNNIRRNNDDGGDDDDDELQIILVKTHEFTRYTAEYQDWERSKERKSSFSESSTSKRNGCMEASKYERREKEASNFCEICGKGVSSIFVKYCRKCKAEMRIAEIRAHAVEVAKPPATPQRRIPSPLPPQTPGNRCQRCGVSRNPLAVNPFCRKCRREFETPPPPLASPKRRKLVPKKPKLTLEHDREEVQQQRMFPQRGSEEIDVEIDVVNDSDREVLPEPQLRPLKQCVRCDERKAIFARKMCHGLVSALDNDEPMDEWVRSLSGVPLFEYVNTHASWRADPSPVFGAHLSPAEVSMLLGAIPETPRYRTAASMRDDTDRAQLPVQFDCATEWRNCSAIIDRIEDQSSCGSCWAISAASAMSDRLCIASEGRIRTQVSVFDLLSCCPSCGYQCRGGYPRMALQHWQIMGVVSGSNYSTGDGCKPYPIEPCRITDSGRRQCPSDPSKPFKCERECASANQKYIVDRYYGRGGVRSYSKFQTAQAQLDMVKNGPLVACFEVYEDFLYYKSGVYHHTAGRYLGVHAVRVVGFGVDDEGTPYWRGANSWNVTWGDGGYFKIRRGKNDCHFEDGILAADADVERSLRGKPK